MSKGGGVHLTAAGTLDVLNTDVDALRCDATADLLVHNDTNRVRGDVAAKEASSDYTFQGDAHVTHDILHVTMHEQGGLIVARAG